MRTDAFDYHLPEELIATTAAEPRDAARLMVCDRKSGTISHHQIRDLPNLGLLRPGDTIILNRSRVVPARFEARRAKTGGKATGLFLSETDGIWRIMLETRGTLQPGERIQLTDDATLELMSSSGGGQWSARYRGSVPTHALLECIGTTPLPPYIRKARKHRHEPEVQPLDAERYNTVYANEAGSVAAPTAGLHLTSSLLQQLETQHVHRAQVILHVGLGTFAPVRSEVIEDHPIHEELAVIPKQTVQSIAQTRAAGGRILAVGTTTVRAIESLPDGADQWAGPTRLFITPDRVASGAFTWRHTDLLLTNFHLPRSTLLALVAALPGVGVNRLMQWYDTAIAHRYRFYSYGDAMLIV